MKKKLLYSYLSSISSLNNIRGTKLKLKLLSLIGQVCKCSNMYLHNCSESNRNERKLQQINGVYLHKYLYLSCLLSVTNELGTTLMLRMAPLVNGLIC